MSDLGAKESCACESCRAACRTRPGWFKPGEAEAAAALLGLSLQDLFDTRLAVDWWDGSAIDDDVSGADVFLLAPAIVGETPGGEYPGSPRGRCTFLTADERCEIHGAKPFECRESWHGERDHRAIHRAAAVAWETPEGQAQVEDLLGREPEATSSSGFGGLLSFFGSEL